ncbi:MAG: hypothetical protein ABSG18_18140 [Steroidobacteraceae bacterium]
MNTVATLLAQYLPLYSGRRISDTIGERCTAIIKLFVKRGEGSRIQGYPIRHFAWNSGPANCCCGTTAFIDLKG